MGSLVGYKYLDLFFFYIAFNSQGHIVTGSLRVEELVGQDSAL